MKRCLRNIAEIKKNKPRAFIPWVLVVAVLLFAFFMSSMSSGVSNELSGFFTDRIAELAREQIDYYNSAPEWRLWTHINMLLRKAAHVVSFFGLTLFVALGVRAVTPKKSRVFLAAILIPLACAAVDELHQIFVSGRGASFGDVLLDLAGTGLALLCVALYLAVKRVIRWLSR